MSFLSNIFGSNNVQPAQINYPGPIGFSSSGAFGGVSNGQYTVGQTPQLASNVANLQNTFQQQSGALGGLAQTVQPGFSQLRQAGLSQLNSQQQSSVSNLRDTLAQRRILGSSFGQNQITQANADFAQQQASFIANSYLQELQASQSLIQQQYQSAAQSFQVGINQSNIETGLAAQLSGQASQIMAQMSSAQAALNQQSAEFNAQQQANSLGGIGKLFGTIFSAGTNTIGGQALGALGSGISSAAAAGGNALGSLLPIFAL